MIYLVYCKYITVIILQYNNTSMTFSFRVYKEILDLFEKNSLLWATQISQKLEISRPIIHKVLNHLLMEKKIEKVWIASHTRYKSLIFSWSNILNSNKVLWINSIKENSDDFIVDFKTKKLLDDNFYKFDSDGSLLIWFFWFKKWVKSRNFDLEKSILNFKNIYNYIENIENNCW